MPPEVEAVRVRLPPEQIVAPPEAEIVGSATTVMTMVFEKEALELH